jgi:hypothetical protein
MLRAHQCQSKRGGAGAKQSRWRSRFEHFLVEKREARIVLEEPQIIDLSKRLWLLERSLYRRALPNTSLIY